jgi:hypothetical protein
MEDVVRRKFHFLDVLMTSLPTDPESVVQRQLEAYNAHDLDGFVATYADDATLFVHPSEVLISGAENIRERYASRFAKNKPHAVVVKRIVVGNTVIDEEEVTALSEGRVTKVHAVVIYEVNAGRISRTWFIMDQ